MPIQAKCEHCGHGYVTRDEMAGRKVRCRQCGLVFTIPAANGPMGNQNAIDTLSSSDLSGDSASGVRSPFESRDSSETRVMMPPVETSESNMSGGIGSAKSRMGRNASAAEFDLISEDGDNAMRVARPFTFPGADILDQWLPWAILGLMLLWSGLTLWNWRPVNPGTELTGEVIEMPAWTGAIPLGLMVLLLLVLWAPIFNAAINKTARKLRFVLPGGHGFRALALASIPLSLASVFWFGAESVAAGITGLVLGAGLSFLAAWFLIRLRQKDFAVAGIAIAIAAGISFAITAGLVYGVNYALQQTVMATHNQQTFAASPLGPDLEWKLVKMDKPVAPKPAAPKGGKPKPTVDDQATEQPTANENTTPATPTKNTDPDKKPPTGPGVAAVKPVPGNPPANPANPADGSANAPQGITIPADFQTTYPMVADIKLLAVPQLGQMLYPLGTPRIAVNVMTTASQQNRIFQKYTVSDTGEMTPTKDRLSVPFDRQYPSCAVSPDGERLVTINRGIDFEFLVRSFKDNSILQRITIGASTAQIRILGFVNNTVMLVESRGLDYQLALVDTTLVKKYAPGVWGDSHSAAVAVLPDPVKIEGTRMAVVATRRGESELRIYNPVTVGIKGVEPLYIPLEGITGVDPGTPAGIAFSADGKRVALAYEPNGQVAIVVIGIPEKKILQKHSFVVGGDFGGGPAAGGPGPVFQGPPGAGGPPPNMGGMMMRASTPSAMVTGMSDRLQWLAGDVWLYNGKYLLEARSETVAADFDAVGQPLQQRILTPQAFQLVLQPRQGTTGLLQVSIAAQEDPAKKPAK